MGDKNEEAAARVGPWPKSSKLQVGRMDWGRQGLSSRAVEDLDRPPLERVRSQRVQEEGVKLEGECEVRVESWQTPVCTGEHTRCCKDQV